MEYYKKATEENDVDSQLKLGNYYYYGREIEQDYKKAIEWYEKAAEQENAEAQCRLAKCYHEGLGIEQDYRIAVKWYKKAAEQGNAEAQNGLGRFERDESKAVEWYKRSAEQGYDWGQYNLAYCYYYGNGVKQDKEKAVAWYRKSAEQGNAEAQNSLASCYYNGQGIEQDYSKAIKWYKRSAKQGNDWGQYNLANCYYNGNGVEQNKEKAVVWYSKSAEQGNTNAQKMLGDCYYDGNIFEKDIDEAEKWYTKAAEQYDTYSIRQVGIIEFEKNNYEEAFKYLLEAAEAGDEEAQEKIGDFYLDGVGGCEVNYRLALYYYFRASRINKNKMGNKLRQVGEEFQYGMDREQDKDMALLCYKIASIAGNQKAKSKLELKWDPYIIVYWESWNGFDILGTGNISVEDVLEPGEEYTFKIELCNMHIENYHMVYRIEENNICTLIRNPCDSYDGAFSVKCGEWTGNNTTKLIVKKKSNAACNIAIRAYCEEFPECAVNISCSC